MKMRRHLLSLVLFCGWPATVVRAGDLNAVVKDNQGAPIADAVVVAVPSTAPAVTGKPKTVIIDQIDKEFVGRVTPVMVGTSVEFPNRDNIRHHVYSFSPAKRFELPLYIGTPAEPIVFDKPGIVKLGCNIHDWMVAYIYVTETPYFGTTGTDGKASFNQLPPGEYDVRLWHPRMELAEESTKQHIVINNTGATGVAWQLSLKPELRPRRAPIPFERGYR